MSHGLLADSKFYAILLLIDGDLAEQARSSGCECGGRLDVGENHSNRYGSHYVYYRCTRKRPGYAICNEPYIREDAVHAQISEALGALAIPRWILEWTFERLEASALAKSAPVALARSDPDEDHTRSWIYLDHIEGNDGRFFGMLPGCS